jgi:hypothetical protein
MTHKIDRLVLLSNLGEIVSKIMKQYKVSFPNEKAKLQVETTNYKITIKKRKFETQKEEL